MKKLAALMITAAALAGSAVPAAAAGDRGPTAAARAPEVVIIEGHSDLVIRVPRQAFLACVKNKTNTWVAGQGDCEPMELTKGRYEATWYGRRVAEGRKLVVLILGGVYRDGRKYTVRVKTVKS